MNLYLIHRIFQWQKLLHFILPIIIIIALQKWLGLVKICVIILIACFLKEIYDTLAWADPIMESVVDMVFNVIGITLGILSCKLINKLIH